MRRFREETNSWMRGQFTGHVDRAEAPWSRIYTKDKDTRSSCICLLAGVDKATLLLHWSEDHQCLPGTIRCCGGTVPCIKLCGSMNPSPCTPPSHPLFPLPMMSHFTMFLLLRLMEFISQLTNAVATKHLKHATLDIIASYLICKKCNCACYNCYQCLYCTIISHKIWNCENLIQQAFSNFT